MHVCESSGAARPAVCNVWLTGVVDGLQAYNTNMRVLPLFSVPDITVGQVAKLLVKYMNDHPANSKMPTTALVLALLVENYPPK